MRFRGVSPDLRVFRDWGGEGGGHVVLDLFSNSHLGLGTNCGVRRPPDPDRMYLDQEVSKLRVLEAS